jgi:hypothetical protein
VSYWIHPSFHLILSASHVLDDKFKRSAVREFRVAVTIINLRVAVTGAPILLANEYSQGYLSSIQMRHITPHDINRITTLTNLPMNQAQIQVITQAIHQVLPLALQHVYLNFNPSFKLSQQPPHMFLPIK